MLRLQAKHDGVSSLPRSSQPSMAELMAHIQRLELQNQAQTKALERLTETVEALTPLSKARSLLGPGSPSTTTTPNRASVLSSRASGTSPSVLLSPNPLEVEPLARSQVMHRTAASAAPPSAAAVAASSARNAAPAVTSQRGSTQSSRNGSSAASPAFSAALDPRSLGDLNFILTPSPQACTIGHGQLPQPPRALDLASLHPDAASSTSAHGHALDPMQIARDSARQRSELVRRYGEEHEADALRALEDNHADHPPTHARNVSIASSAASSSNGDDHASDARHIRRKSAIALANDEQKQYEEGTQSKSSKKQHKKSSKSSSRKKSKHADETPEQRAERKAKKHHQAHADETPEERAERKAKKQAKAERSKSKKSASRKDSASKSRMHRSISPSKPSDSKNNTPLGASATRRLSPSTSKNHTPRAAAARRLSTNSPSASLSRSIGSPRKLSASASTPGLPTSRPSSRASGGGGSRPSSRAGANTSPKVQPRAPITLTAKSPLKTARLLTRVPSTDAPARTISSNVKKLTRAPNNFGSPILKTAATRRHAMVISESEKAAFSPTVDERELKLEDIQMGSNTDALPVSDPQLIKGSSREFASPTAILRSRRPNSAALAQSKLLGLSRPPLASSTSSSVLTSASQVVVLLRDSSDERHDESIEVGIGNSGSNSLRRMTYDAAIDRIGNVAAPPPPHPPQPKQIAELTNDESKLDFMPPQTPPRSLRHSASTASALKSHHGTSASSSKRGSRRGSPSRATSEYAAGDESFQANIADPEWWRAHPSDSMPLSKKRCGVEGCREKKLKGKHWRYCYYHEKPAFYSNPNARQQKVLEETYAEKQAKKEKRALRRATMQ